MKKNILRITAVVLAVLLVLVATISLLFLNELRSLGSIRRTDDYGAFQMTYFGDYGFDEFLKTGAKNDGDIEKFVTTRLLKGLPINLDISGAGCTAFVTRNEKGDVIYGRNFDFRYAPSMQLMTDPDNGYSSISTVNLSFAGYDEESLPSGIDAKSFLALAAPYLPFDGMNEKGVCIALLAVPEAEAPQDDSRVTLNTTTLIRLVLDKAATTEEAIELMGQYNMYFSGDVECHYLVADRSGASAIVEYFQGEVCVTKSDKTYQIASNFITYDGVNIGEGYNEFERYDAVEATILENNEALSEAEAMELLAEIGIVDEGVDKLQWSVIYNLTTGEVSWFAHRNTNNVITSSIAI